MPTYPHNPRDANRKPHAPSHADAQSDIDTRHNIDSRSHQPMRDWNIVDDAPEMAAPGRSSRGADEADDRLNANRIRAIALDLRAAHRRRLWAMAVVFGFACLSVMTAVDAARGVGARRLWFAAGAAAFAVLAVRAARRLRRFTIPSPSASAFSSATSSTTPPDAAAFDALSDGSQFARRLGDLPRDRDG